MPKAQAAATAATGFSSSPAKQASETQAETNKSTNTQAEKTSEGRSATADTQSVGEGPAGLAAMDDATTGDGHSSKDPSRIEIVAYQLWLDRGSPIGSPEVDWIEAVRICQKGEA